MKKIALLLAVIFCISTVAFAAGAVNSGIKGKGQKIEKKVTVVKVTKIKVVKETKTKCKKAEAAKCAQKAPEKAQKRNLWQKIWHKLFGGKEKPAGQKK